MGAAPIARQTPWSMQQLRLLYFPEEREPTSTHLALASCLQILLNPANESTDIILT